MIVVYFCYVFYDIVYCSFVYIVLYTVSEFNKSVLPNILDVGMVFCKYYSV